MKTGLLGIAALLAVQTTVAAQDGAADRRSHFGVIGTVALPSDVRSTFAFYFDVERVDARSQDFEIGLIARGRELGGDWGVSYIQKTYREGSALDDTSNSCIEVGCFDFGRHDIMQDVRLSGISVHKFAPFVTIKRRAQVGLNFSGGIARARGHVERHQLAAYSIQGPPTETVTQVDANEVFLDGKVKTKPLWKVEIMAAALVAPGLKVRVGGGLNFTNYPAFSISASYLFGTR